jgi:hypothetical protein
MRLEELENTQYELLKHGLKLLDIDYCMAIITRKKMKKNDSIHVWVLVVMDN